MKKEVSVFWFRRDLRLEDNCAMFHALNSEFPILPVFIFDTNILSELPKNDARVQFIHQSLAKINDELQKENASLYILNTNITDAWEQIFEEFDVKNVFFNRDYEPYATKRDAKISRFCKEKGATIFNFKDQVIFEKSEITKADGLPYTVYTPYKKKWLLEYNNSSIRQFPSEKLSSKFLKETFHFPTLKEIGFEKNKIEVLPINSKCIDNYVLYRDIPSIGTSNISVHLRFGTVSVRRLIAYAIKTEATFTSELIWREFFMQILYHFPKVVNENFKAKYNFIKWRNNEEEFKLWCEGKTGYPIVDAGMRQLNETGYMHNRVRMIVASFLNKHLLIDWRWGEAYFAQKLLDFELSANNGNWQWVAGTGCDSAPYFRVFNPTTQQQKFDSDFKYIEKWNPNYKVIPEIVEHKFARERYLTVLKKALLN
ncbi:cryptochrome/photolyase family protein [Lutibacter flavus]|uniref:Deoxyribodipyrimidine photo-lyase n=1 Tax=Lutibacter flavus TaxID=691689 RepID=A0A238VTL1_9FLAO|nr:deoxyribodipyrimidine photo-lyase [Lutibacter flavus]SNR37494.1 deoxyribodipyrimidine photo-lyase [Lutibacter flavus]